MQEAVHIARLVRFGVFEVDLRSGELRKAGARLKISGQPFQVLAILLENPGEIVTREDLMQRLWPDTFVDGDHNLNTAVNKIRDVLGDSAENPRFIETLPRRGYRFIAPVEGTRLATPPDPVSPPPAPVVRSVRWGLLHTGVLIGAILLVAIAGLYLYKRHRVSEAVVHQRALTRLTSDEGLQTGATWSPDGRFIAYSSDRGGKYDIWIQQISGGDPIQITKGPGQNWMPDWSPDGKYIAYRSEEGEGGIYITPALGGTGLQRKVASFGYYPHWSPDSSRILFLPLFGFVANSLYVVGLDGSPPREILNDLAANRVLASATWHPDGKRITAWIPDYAAFPVGNPVPIFSTEPVDGGRPIESRFSPELQKQMEALAVAGGIPEWRMDVRFAWAPSGKALFFERSFRGARNLWRMTVDPATLQPTHVERLTTSPGLEAEPSVSPDGTRLAFTSERQQIRAWAFPFDANHGRVTGRGEAVTSAGIEAWSLHLSRDGKKLGVWGIRDGKTGAWETSVPKGREQPLLAADSYYCGVPVWSPDGKRAAYTRVKELKGDPDSESQLVVWSSDNRTEETVEAGGGPHSTVFDWSPDGKSVLLTRYTKPSPSIWQIFVDRPSSGKSSPRKIISDPNYEVYQAHFSRDGRWIVFNAVKSSNPTSTIYAIPAAGGSWIRITDSKQWDDKPRWSPDGRTIYYLAEQKGFFNVWGVHFDPVKGKPQGEPFQVTSLETPALMIPKNIIPLDFSLTDGRMVLPIVQVSGNIWILDNVDR